MCVWRLLSLLVRCHSTLCTGTRGCWREGAAILLALGFIWTARCIPEVSKSHHPSPAIHRAGCGGSTRLTSIPQLGIRITFRGARVMSSLETRRTTGYLLKSLSVKEKIPRFNVLQVQGRFAATVAFRCVFVAPYLPSPFVFPTTVGERQETAVSSCLLDLLVSPFSLPFSSIFHGGVGSHLSIWSWGGVGRRARPAEARRALSVVHCPNLMRENANICMTRNGPLHSAHTKNTNKVYGTTFIQAGEEFTTYDEFCRKTLFFHFSSSAHNVL